MLAGDGVGKRSGTRPLEGLAVCQKKSNVRRSTSSGSGSPGATGAGGGGGGPGDVPAQPQASAPARASSRRRPVWTPPGSAMLVGSGKAGQYGHPLKSRSG